MAQVRTLALLGGVSFERALSLDEAQEHLEDTTTLLWVDVQDPGDEEISRLMDIFGFHPLAMEDVAKGEQRPKVDDYKTYIFTVTYGIARGATPAESRHVELHLFVGKNYLVSIHRESLPALDEAMQRWTRGGTMLKEGIGFVLYAVFDAIVDAYFPVVDALEQVIDRAEDAMVRGPTDEQVGNLLDIRREVLRLRRILYPMREAFSTLTRRERPVFSAGTQIYFQDVNDHLLRVVDLIDAQRDLVTSALDASLTIVSNRLNATMKRLTTISASVGFAAAVFGAWGMNFTALPISESAYGFPVIVGGTVAVLFAIFQLARRRGWL